MKTSVLHFKEICHFILVIFLALWAFLPTLSSARITIEKLEQNILSGDQVDEEFTRIVTDISGNTWRIETDTQTELDQILALINEEDVQPVIAMFDFEQTSKNVWVLGYTENLLKIYRVIKNEEKIKAQKVDRFSDYMPSGDERKSAL